MEVWRDVPGYEGLYQVSDCGNVRSLNYKRKGTVGLLYLKRHPNGYRQVELHKDGKKRMLTVHRLVASAFLPKPTEGQVVNHLNEDKYDNRVSNLEWCSFAENVRYSRTRHPIDRPLKRTRAVLQLTKTGEFVKEWNNLITIKHKLGFNEFSVSECCEGNRKTAYGFKWQYAS
jgi:hypothetical protein